MSDLFIARSLFAWALIFHIILAALGVGMPLLMVLSEYMYHRTKKEVWLELAKRWSKMVAILVVVGVVSGTAVSMLLGLLWPGFMEKAGPLIGVAFSLEGFAFFIEATFFTLYLYGWNRLSPRAHMFAGVMVAIGAAMSGVLVMTANAFMQHPAGFEINAQGEWVELDPIAAILNRATPHLVIHMMLTAYATTAFLAASLHGYLLLKDRDNEFHRKALTLALGVAIVSTPLLIGSGDFAAKRVAELQPEKFAAMEALYENETEAGLLIGGIPDNEARETKYALKIPFMLSFLAHGDLKTEVKGLNACPEDQWPNVFLVHTAFDVMVGCGMFMLAMAGYTAVFYYRKREIPASSRYLKLLILAGPAAVIAMEAGWIVTEVGRQPWIIYQVMRTEDAVTPATNLMVPLVFYTLLYLVLGLFTIVMLRYQIKKFPASPKTKVASEDEKITGTEEEVREDHATEPAASDQESNPVSVPGTIKEAPDEIDEKGSEPPRQDEGPKDSHEKDEDHGEDGKEETKEGGA